MRLDHAIVVKIDFDDDFDFPGGSYDFYYPGYIYGFYQAGAWEEARDIVKKAMLVMADHWETRRGEKMDSDDGIVEEIANDNDKLDAFMCKGGEKFGNWMIEVILIGRF